MKSKHEPLTIEKFRKYPGLENLSDEEALDAIVSLEQFADLLYNLVKTQKQQNNER